MAASGESSRGFVLARRSTAISDMSRISYTAGDMTFDAAADSGLLTQNAVHMVGIATQTESRLDASRYPIQIRIGPNPGREKRHVTSFGFWRVVDAGHANIEFDRASVITDKMGTNVRTLFPNLDQDWWSWRTDKAAVVCTGRLDAALVAHQTIIMNAVALDVIPAETITAARNALVAINTACAASNVYPHIQLAANIYVTASPVGTSYAQVGTLTPNGVILRECGLTVKVNAMALRARYPTASDGAVNFGAHAVAMMFKMGMQETREHEEFVTIYVDPVAGNDNQYTVREVVGPVGYNPPAFAATGQIIDRSDARTNKELLEIGNLLVFTAGLMHYLFNHTTGGTRVSGTLATILSGRSIIVNGMSFQEVENVTSIMYECLHPVNKRAVANLMYKNSRVFSHGKSTHSRPYAQLAYDSFVQIRKNPYPAGSHKAFTLATGLKRLIQASIANFLPWYSNINDCIDQCTTVLNSGARAHVGAHYYTGAYPLTQTSSLDAYLPEVAAYIQMFHRNDSLAMSPHLSMEVAARASTTFTTLIKNLKNKDMSDANIENVQAYLASVGHQAYELDLKDQNTWGGAVAANAQMIERLDRVFEM